MGQGLGINGQRIGSDELPDFLAFWTKELRLQDWELDISILRKSKMSVDNVCGSIWRDRFNKYARIELMDPDDTPDNTTYDMEQTLVHELLHLHINWWVNDGDFHGMEKYANEQAINILSKALVNLRRLRNTLL